MNLHKYQHEGADWLRPRRTALLADEMGLGKSAQAIRAAEGLPRLLIVCPSVAKVNWLRELSKWSGTPRVYKMFGAATDEFNDTDSVVTSYGMLRRHLSKLTSKPWDAGIFDEAHMAFGESEQAAALWSAGGLLSKCGRRWFLSGTPIVNHPGDVWPLLYCTGRTPLSREAFLKEFCHTYRYKNRVVVKGANIKKTPALRALLQEVMLRRVKSEVGVELPPISYHDLVLEPGPVDPELLGIDWVFPKDRTADLRAQLDVEKQLLLQAFAKGEMTLARLALLAESVATLRRWTAISKIQPVVELVKGELAAGNYEKIVIFGHHRAVIEGIRAGLDEFGPVTLYGGTPQDTRQKNIDRFQKNPKCRVFVGNLTACATAIDLTAADQGLVVEPPWTPSLLDQATARLHRLTQTRPVTIRFATVPDGVDELVMRVLRRKESESFSLLETKFPKAVDRA